MDARAVRRRLARRVPVTPRERTHVVAGTFGLAATGFVLLAALAGGWLGVPVGAGSLAYGVAWLAPSAGLAAAALAWPLWWTLVEDRGGATLFETAVVGLLVGVAAHPATWLVYLAGGAVVAAAGSPAPPGAEGLTGPVDVLATAAAYGLTGLFVAGVVSIFVGVGVAVGVASLRDTAVDD